jgi:hypothetical protein
MDDAKLFYQMHYPLSPFSEAMRTLRSGIHMSDVDQPPKIIQVTSARPSDNLLYTSFDTFQAVNRFGAYPKLSEVSLRLAAFTSSEWGL